MPMEFDRRPKSRRVESAAQKLARAPAVPSRSAPNLDRSVITPAGYFFGGGDEFGFSVSFPIAGFVSCGGSKFNGAPMSPAYMLPVPSLYKTARMILRQMPMSASRRLQFNESATHGIRLCSNRLRQRLQLCGGSLRRVGSKTFRSEMSQSLFGERKPRDRFSPCGVRSLAAVHPSAPWD
jgi:hypothetical protein